MFSTQQYFGFDPRTIPGCYIWNDAATLSTLANGTTVGTWSNSASSVSITTAGTVSNSQLNNRTIVNFTVDQSWNTTPVIDLSAYSMFAVMRQTGVTNGRVLESVTGNQLFGYWNGYKKSLFIEGNPSQLSTATSDTSWDIMSHTRVSGGAYTFNWNGSNIFSGSTSTTSNLTGLWINSGARPTQRSTCQLAELIVFSNVITSNQTQQVEGYLAWKWGLQTNLPTGHPFRPNPTTMRIFQPTDISGCSLWLDAADLSTIIRSGNNVTQINDKSPLNLVVTVSNGATANPVTIQNGGLYINNNSSQNYNASTYSMLVVQSNILTTTSFSMFVVLNNPTNVTSAIISDPRALASSGETRTQLNHGFIFEVATNGTNRMTSPTTAAGTGNRILAGLSSPSRSDFYNNGTLAGSNTSSISPYSTDVGGLPTIGGYRNTESGSSDNSWFTGTIYEVIIYTSNVTDSQRQQIEGYLASKWGISGSLPTTHPYYLQRALPSTPLFTPTMISNCSLWLDAADLSTITLSGSSVIQWNDKSGNSRNVTQSTPSLRPSFSANTIIFDGTRILSGGSTTLVNPNNGSWSVFVVCYTTTTSLPTTVSQNIIDQDQRLKYTRVAQYVRIGGSGGASLVRSLGFINDNTVYGALGASLISENKPIILAGVNTTSNIISYMNGVSGTPSTHTQSVIASTPFTVGGRDSESALNSFFYGGIFEIILYSDSLTTEQRQLVEGYLAWKWGLQTKLSSFPVPTQLSGCTLWLDAADSSQITLSGSTVTTWRDKSSSALNATGGSTTGPTYVTGGLNGLNTITFNGTTQFMTSGSTVPGNTHTLIAVHKPNTAAGNTSLFRFQQNNGAYVVFPYYDAGNSQPFGYISQFDSLQDFGTSPTLPENSSTANFNIITASIGTTTIIRNNGVQTASSSYTRTTGTSDTLTIGRYTAGNNQYYSGTVCEMIVFNRDLTISEITQMEGYLAWKWGIQAVIPTSHPYYKFRP